jgi:hypothetical protein
LPGIEVRRRRHRCNWQRRCWRSCGWGRRGRRRRDLSRCERGRDNERGCEAEYDSPTLPAGSRAPVRSGVSRWIAHHGSFRSCRSRRLGCGGAYAIPSALPLRMERLQWRLTRVVV